MAKPAPSILGVFIDTLTINQAIEQIIDHAASKQSARYIVKPYVEFFDRAKRDADVRNLLNQAWLRLPESISAQWAAAYLTGQPSIWRALRLTCNIIVNTKVLTSPIPEKFGGTIFTWKLLEACTAQRLSIYLIGSPRQGDINRTANAIQARLPSLTIVGTWPGQWGGMEGEELRRRLRTAPIEAKLLADLQKRKPDIMLVGMGFPLQEELMAKLVPQLAHGAMIGEGGTFDYDSFGGTRTKAPMWMQHIGLEWLWRLILEPSRWRRQLAIPRFMWAVYRSGRTTTKTIPSRD